MIKQRVSKLQLNLEKLLKMEPKTMKCAIEWYRIRPKCHGVYVVSKSKDEEIIYFGRSKTASGGVRQRLRQHFYKEALSRYKATRQDVEKFLVRVLEEKDFVARRNLEMFAISVISPRFNRD